LYSRFYHKLLRDFGYVDSDEPFKNLLTQGMVLADSWYSTDEKGVQHWHAPDDVEPEADDAGKIIAGTLKETGEKVLFGGVQKMSKSKNNGIDPQSMIDKFGADTIRLFVMFASPPDQTLEWSDAGVEGAFRFLKRLWRMVSLFAENGVKENVSCDISGLSKAKLNSDQQALRRKVHQTIAKVTGDMHQRHTFNTAIAAVMEMLNQVSKFQEASESETDYHLVQEALQSAVLLLAPIVPHITQKMWQNLGQDGLICDSTWPVAEESAMVENEKLVIVQVNGKLRARLKVAADIDKQQLEKLALEDEGVQRHTEGKTIRKVIVIPGKLVNIVVSD